MPVIPVLGRRQAEGRDHKFTFTLGYSKKLSPELIGKGALCFLFGKEIFC